MSEHVKWYQWIRVTINVLLGREDPADRPVEPKRRPKASIHIRQLLYGATPKGKKLHVVASWHSSDSYLCGVPIPSGPRQFSQRPEGKNEICQNCKTMLERGKG